MSNFISEIKKIKTDKLIYELSSISIEMYNDSVSYTKKIPIMTKQFGCYKKKEVLLTAWDIPSIEYLSITNSNDYRNCDTITSLPGFINAYRKYENDHSASQIIKNSDTNGVFRTVLGMTSEQFQFQNTNLIFEKLNRNYHILVAAENYAHRKELDVTAAVQSTFRFSAEDYLAISLLVFWLCSKYPDPLSTPENIYNKKDSTIFTKENITKFVEYYSCTYDDLRKSSLQKQCLYSKPFIHTKRHNLYLSSSIFLVVFLLGNGLYWLVRDYYKNDKQKFPNAFGLLFEDYIKELASTYCKSTEWQVIQQGDKKGADFIFKFDSLQMIVESKSSMLRLDVKQQVPNLNSVNTFFDNTIKKSYKQLNNSYEQLKNNVETPTIKIILLYDEFSNTAIIEQSMSEIFEKDLNCFIMTIRQLEILLFLHKYDTIKFNLIINKIIESIDLESRNKNFDAIYNELSIFENPHLNDNLNYVEHILQHFANNLNDDD